MWGESSPMGFTFSIKMLTCISSINTVYFNTWELTSLMVHTSFWLMWELGIDVWVKIMYSLPWDWSWVWSGGTAGSFMATEEFPQPLFTVLRKTQLNLTRDCYNLLSCSFDIIAVFFSLTSSTSHPLGKWGDIVLFSAVILSLGCAFTSSSWNSFGKLCGSLLSLHIVVFLYSNRRRQQDLRRVLEVWFVWI